MASASPPYSVEALGPQHDRSRFSCGVEALDTYLIRQAKQDMRRRLSTTMVMIDHTQDNYLVGFYTLAVTALRLEVLPQAITKKLPKYPLIPAFLLGRLAVDQSYQGKGLGKIILMDALKRCWAQEIPSFLVLVDAKGERAKQFYERQGFISLEDQPFRLYLPMATVAQLFNR